MSHIIARVISGFITLVLLVVLLAGVGGYAYQLGAQQVAVTAGADGVLGGPRFAPPYYYGFHPFGFGFGFLNCLVPLFLIVLMFSVLRLVRYTIFGHHPRWHKHWAGKTMPPMFEEWHKQAHSTPTPEAEKK